MCWNADISINTFVFACFALVFIYFTNTFTKYKLKEFENPLVYLYFLLIAIMQLLEFFIWRNLKNKSVNTLVSKIASFVVILQPLTIMLMIPNLNIKYYLLTIYAIFIMVYLAYKTLYNPIHFYSHVAKNNHLTWEWVNLSGYEYIFYFGYVLLYLLALLFIDNFVVSFFVILMLVVSFIFHFKYNTFGSMWCWLTNLILIYFLMQILIIKPYYEYNGLC
jgi:hypothetical protein